VLRDPPAGGQLPAVPIRREVPVRRAKGQLLRVRAVRYSIEINIHNGQGKEAPVLKRAIPLVLAGAVLGREPKFKAPVTKEAIRLPAHRCQMELLLGAAPGGSGSGELGDSGNYQHDGAERNGGVYGDRWKWRCSLD